LALTLTMGIWWGLPDLNAHGRVAFITFALAILGWAS
jgi:hypothetical protein